MKAKVLCVSLVVAQSLWAMNVDKDNFYTRDYLDFGQNLGQFTPGAKNLTITRKDGVVVDLPDLPFPDFSKFDGSNRTSVGGAYTASAKHIVHPRDKFIPKPNIKLGDSSYADQKDKIYATDSAYTRVNKFIVEGGYKVTSLRDVKQNAENYMTRYKGEEHILVYRSGSGRMSFQRWDGGPGAGDSVKTGVRAGGLFFVKKGNISDAQLLIQRNGNHYGPLKGLINTGDSGSPAFVFNNKTKEWELIGTVHGATPADPKYQSVVNTFWAVVNPNQLAEFKKQFERERQIGNDGQYIQEKDKDSVYTDSGTITINEDVDQGIGGIILRGGGKTLNITGSGSFKGAGIDIDEKDSKVVWDIEVKDSLHKIGKGELEVTKQTNGALRMGEGKVRLRAENSFNSVYLGNREGELIFDTENAVKDFNISFSKSGGTLNLNGFNATMSGVKAYNASAFITNKNEEKLSTLTLNNTSKTMIHAHISGNTAIQAQATNNNTSSENGKSGSKGDSANRAIIFDGGFAIKELKGSNQHIVLQGKPVPHATWEGGCTGGSQFPIPIPKECKVGHYINRYESQYSNMITQGVSFNQPDWLQREYSGNISLDSGSKLYIEKNADVKANITLDSSTLEFNSKMLYLDSNDSKNLNQDIKNQNLNGNIKPKDTITYKGDIIAKNSSKIESKNGIKSFEASVYLDNKSTFTAQQDDIKLLAGGLTLLNNSTFTAKSLSVDKVESLIWIDKDSSLSLTSGITIKDSPFTALYTAKEDFSKSNATTPTARSTTPSPTAQANTTITANNSTLYIAKDSKIPSITLQNNSKVWFEYMNDSTNLSKINFTSNGGSNNIMAQTLHHAQGQNMAWINGNNGGSTGGSGSSIAGVTITDMLYLSNVGSTSSSTSSANTNDDNRFLALDLSNTNLTFENNARVNVKFANSHDELFADTTLNHDGSKLYPMIKAKSLETKGDLIVGFEGQTSRSIRQAVATHTSTGIDISFTDINQVDPSKILSDISKTLPSINDIDSRQKTLLDSLLQAQRDHYLVLDAAFNKHSVAAASQLLQGIQKIDDNAKQIAKNVSQDTNLALINEYHNVITNRINVIASNNTSDVTAYKYAALKSDIPLGYLVGNKELMNNVWMNVGGGYFNGDGNLKYYSTNIGYDRRFGSRRSGAVVGGLLSFGGSVASNKAYSDNAMNYGAGLYTAMKFGVNELQLDGSYIASLSQKSAQNVSKVESLNHSVGANAVYKYALEIGKSNAIKPLLGLEYVANMMAGYSLDLLRVNDYTYYALSGLAGLEYAYMGQSFFFSIRGAGKRAVMRSGDVQVGIDGANRFIGYALQDNEMIYKLDCMGDYRVGSLSLGAAMNFQTTMSGRMGVSGLVKMEYRF